MCKALRVLKVRHTSTANWLILSRGQAIDAKIRRRGDWRDERPERAAEDYSEVTMERGEPTANANNNTQPIAIAAARSFFIVPSP
ncbi:hypothetical protein ACSJLX_003646 [Serratia marcescens]